MTSSKINGTPLVQLRLGLNKEIPGPPNPGANVILLTLDLAKAFANNVEAVNEASRLVNQLTKVPVGKR